MDEALKKGRGRSLYDVVLCDLTMPDVGAEGWLSSCASLDPRLADRAILVTGGPTSAEASALIKARRDKVVLRPFEFPSLLSMIERVARH